MGSAEIDTVKKELLITSRIITYGHAATAEVTEDIREEIETLWNEPAGSILLDNQAFSVRFIITASCHPALLPEEIFSNTDPCNNYFRIEAFSMNHISFVDGLGCNTGYFKLDNLYKGSTTAAHEYGHTLGLKHPRDLDLRGKGIPGIMYPRGTLVDPEFQYNPAARSGDNTNGGTMHPRYRKVLPADITALQLPKVSFKNGKAAIGDFTSLWHPDHADLKGNK